MAPNHTMHRTSNRILKSLLADSTGLSLNKYRQWLRNKGSAEAEYERVGTYVSEEDYTTARLIRDSIPDKFELTGYGYYEYLYYVDYTEIIWAALEDTIHYSELDSVNVLAVQYIADNSMGLAGVLAQGLLNEYYSYNYEVIPQEPSGQQGLIGSQNNNPVIAHQIQQTFIAMPNPANKEVTFHCEVGKNVSSASIQVFNLNGQMVRNFQIGNGRNTILWDAEQQPNGVYYCKFLQAGESPNTLKLILIK
jgi:hypothetical protein